jgi:hypothetical protein
VGLLDSFRRLIRGTPPEPRPATGASTFGDMDLDQAAAWLKAFESGQLNPPRDVHDAEAWDRYWKAHIEVGPMEQGFGDMMGSDPGLVSTLDRRGARSILCVGAGLSSEPMNLAMHGFDVSALDISSIPQRWFQAMIADSSHPIHQTPGLVVRGDGTIAFDPNASITAEHCSPMHRADGRPPKGGGSISYVTGDVVNAEACPGLFDAVIERRTLQLFPPDEKSAALDSLAARMAARVLFVSHQHKGNWKPNEPREHFARDWARQRGFTEVGGESANSVDRVAWLRFTSG